MYAVMMAIKKNENYWRNQANLGPMCDYQLPTNYFKTNALARRRLLGHPLSWSE